MVRRGGYYSMAPGSGRFEDEDRQKEIELEKRRIAMIKRCDSKIARRHLQAEQRKIRENEKLSRVQEAMSLNQKEVEVTHRLATELSRCKNKELRILLSSLEELLSLNKEIKHARKFELAKSSSRLPSSCAPSRLEEKVRLQASQAELSKLWHQDKIMEKLRLGEEGKKKQNLRIDLQNRLMDNHRQVQERRKKEKEQDCRLIEQEMRKVQQEDAQLRKKKNNDVILLKAEMAASLATKDAWEREYKEALRDEDDRITRIVAEKEAQQEKLLNEKTEFCATKEAVVDKAARKLLETVCISDERERQEISNELYQEEQRSKWTTEPARLALRKQYATAESLKEMARRQKAITECKMKEDAIDAAFTRYLAKEFEQDVGKRKRHNVADLAKKIQHGKELKEAITNNKVSYAMNILERQFEIRAHNENINQSLIAMSLIESNDRTNDNKITRKENN